MKDVPTCFEILADLFAADVDRELLRQAQARTPTERLTWLEEMQAFADDAKEARRNETERTNRNAG